MNWKEISEEYPNAWKEFIKYDPEATVTSLLNHRELFDFFDEQKIYIGISARKKRHSEQAQFSSVVNRMYSLMFSARNEAEIDAFTTAFEMLECRLNKVDFLP